MRIIGFGTYDRTRHPRAGILLDGLAELGDEIIEVNAPMGFSTSERVAMLSTPTTAWRLPVRLASRWLRLVARRFRLAGSRPDAILVGYLGHFDVLLARLLYPTSVIALDLLIFAGDTARDRGVSRSRMLRLLNLLDSLAMRAASVIIVDTDEHAALVPERYRDKVVTTPVGADVQWFETASDGALRDAGAPNDATSPGLDVVFFGLFTPLQGAPVIGEALSLIPEDSGVKLTLIGSGQDLEATKRAAGTGGAAAQATWLDWVEPDELLAIVARHDVCLGIFGTNAKALRVVPNKVYQGAAAGCAILTSDTTPQRRALGDAARYVPAGDAGALAQALRELAADREELRRLRESARTTAADRFRPAQVAAPLRDKLTTSLQRG